MALGSCLNLVVDEVPLMQNARERDERDGLPLGNGTERQLLIRRLEPTCRILEFALELQRRSRILFGLRLVE